MSTSFNKVILVGNCGKKPMIRTMQDSKKMAVFSLATTEVWYDKTKKKREKTEWHKIVVYQENLVNQVIKPYVAQGSRLLVEGSLEYKKWTDSKGIERLIPEIVLNGYNSSIIILDNKNQNLRKEASSGEFEGEVYPLTSDEDVQESAKES